MKEDYETTLESARDDVAGIYGDYDDEKVSNLDSWLEDKTSTIVEALEIAENEAGDLISARDARIEELEARIEELEREVTELEAEES